jgi:hypothetical protein
MIGHPVKIDDSFLDQSRAKPGAAVSAIIEIDVPMPKVTMRRERLGTGGRAASARVQSITPYEGAPELMEQAARLISDVVDHPPVPLASASSFVVDLTPKQAEALADSPLVRRIYGNLRLI